MSDGVNEFVRFLSIAKGSAGEVRCQLYIARDQGYIDDVVEGVVRVLDCTAKANANWDGKNPYPATSKAPWRVYNIGNSSPVDLMDYIKAIENALGKSAEKNFMPMQAGDVPATSADVQALMDDVGFKPDTPVEEGVKHFVDWYRDYYEV